MYKYFETLKTKVAAVANQGGAMEFRDHFKNGANLKSQTSKGNFNHKEV